MTPPILTLENITAGYGNDPVIRNIDLKVFAHDFIGIIGPNGGGKTTLVKVILKLIEPMTGKVTFQSNIKPGYLPQINKTDRDFPITVLDVVLSGFGKQKLSRSTRQKKANELLEMAGLRGKQKSAIGELSGGEVQRALLCRAIITDPDLLILDEPNTYVDRNFEEDLYNLLLELNKSMAIILVSHDIGTISSVVKTIACVNGGLHYHPSNKITNEILQSYNCPIEIITHGVVPHRVLKKHSHNEPTD